ncbi:MAG: TIGR00252 family protein [Candidatus Kentron sp. G]|nr:MAG: TIGR00252 family protein [Candidatus Kentron sp. G]VFM96987.1 MAG: TIGR00252 family protein [Candidatus Kentron sp. G]VFM99362.1 MAG: TIGR00252 family protein [Candidatus Kentron sp. G]
MIKDITRYLRRAPRLGGDDESGHAGLPERDRSGDLARELSSAERGAWAERLAAAYLRDKGMRVLARNYRCRFGEIDLILRQGVTTVFAEVRFRRNSCFGTGLDSVDSRKKRRIVMSARHFLQQNPLLRDKPCRFDIVSISLSNEGSTGQGNSRNDSSRNNIQWIPAAFDGF